MTPLGKEQTHSYSFIHPSCLFPSFCLLVCDPTTYFFSFLSHLLSDSLSPNKIPVSVNDCKAVLIVKLLNYAVSVYSTRHVAIYSKKCINQNWNHVIATSESCCSFFRVISIETGNSPYKSNAVTHTNLSAKPINLLQTGTVSGWQQCHVSWRTTEEFVWLCLKMCIYWVAQLVECTTYRILTTGGLEFLWLQLFFPSATSRVPANRKKVVDVTVFCSFLNQQ